MLQICPYKKQHEICHLTPLLLACRLCCVCGYELTNHFLGIHTCASYFCRNVLRLLEAESGGSEVELGEVRKDGGQRVRGPRKGDTEDKKGGLHIKVVSGG